MNLFIVIRINVGGSEKFSNTQCPFLVCEIIMFSCWKPSLLFSIVSYYKWTETIKLHKFN